MKISEISALEQSDLNGFLFSVIGSETNGLDFSVVSLLARTGADPWREAARLAALPKQAAKEWLAQAIANGAASNWPLPEARVIAARLVTALPNRTPGARVTKPLYTIRIRDLRKALVPAVLCVAGATIVYALMHIGMR